MVSQSDDTKRLRWLSLNVTLLREFEIYSVPLSQPRMIENVLERTEIFHEELLNF